MFTYCFVYITLILPYVHIMLTIFVAIVNHLNYMQFLKLAEAVFETILFFSKNLLKYHVYVVHSGLHKGFVNIICCNLLFLDTLTS